jgi:hypothetical protein
MVSQRLPAWILASYGQYRDAEQLVRSVVALAAKIDLLTERGDTLPGLSHVLAAAGQVSMAQSAAAEALRTLPAQGQPARRPGSRRYFTQSAPAERVPLMPHPYVTRVTVKANQIVLTIKVDEYPTGEPLEISGYATQNGGAFAVFNDIQAVPEPNPDDTAYMYLTALPSQDFKKGHAVTVVLRAARVWATVLGEPQIGEGPSLEWPELAEAGTAWNVIKSVSTLGWSTDPGAKGRNLVHSDRRRIPGAAIEQSEAAKEMSELANLSGRVSATESYLREQIAASGIWLTEGGPELDVVQDVDFSFELITTPSLQGLLEVVSQVNRVISVAAGFAAYTHPDLEIWSDRSPENLTSLEEWLQENDEVWDLEIEVLELGSLRLKLKPKGKDIKKVVKNGVATVAFLANLATLTGVTTQSAVSSIQSKPNVSHSVVHSNGKMIPLSPPSSDDVIVRLPGGSKITETIRLSHGKSIEWQFTVGSGGASVSMPQDTAQQ